MLASELAYQLLHYASEYGDYPVVLNDEDGWRVGGPLAVGEDGNDEPVVVVYDVAH